MFKETLLQTIGVVIGAIIGALISWKMAGSFWWIGALSGGIVGYFLGEFQQVKEGLRIIFQGLIRGFASYNLKKRFLVGMGTGLSFSIAVGALFLFMLLSRSPKRIESLEATLASVSIVIFTLSLIPALFMSNKGFRYRYVSLEADLRIVSRDWANVLLIGPAMVGLVIAGIFVGIVYSCLNFLRYIHSRKRILRFIDASLSSMIAYLVAGTIPGLIAIAFLAGMIISPLHYHLISVKLLKLAPNGGKA